MLFFETVEFFINNVINLTFEINLDIMMLRLM